MCRVIWKEGPWGPIFTVFPVIDEDVQHRCFTEGYLLCEHCVAARHHAVIGKQLLLSNDRNKVLGPSESGTCADLFGNLSGNSLARDLSNNTTVNPPLSSLVKTFNKDFFWKWIVYKTWFCRQVDLPALVKHGEAGLDRGISTAGAAPVLVLIKSSKISFKAQIRPQRYYYFFHIESAQMLQRKQLQLPRVYNSCSSTCV